MHDNTRRKRLRNCILTCLLIGAALLPGVAFTAQASSCAGAQSGGCIGLNGQGCAGDSTGLVASLAGLGGGDGYSCTGVQL